MSTAVYIGDRIIQIVEGTYSKNKIVAGKAITESKDLQLKDIWEKYQLSKKDIRLVVSSANLMTKQLTIPKLNERKSLEIIRREFQEIENPDQYLYDYRFVTAEGKGMQAVLSTACEKSLVDTYKKEFEELGVKVTSMDISINTLSKIIGIAGNETAPVHVLVQFSESSLLCALVVESGLLHVSRYRIFSESGTKEFAVEVTNRVSGYLQFAGSEYRDAEIRDIYLGGLAEENWEYCQKDIQALGVNVQLISDVDCIQMPTLEGQNVQGHYSFALGGLIRQKQDINLWESKSEEKQSKTGLSKGWFIGSGIVLGVCLLVAAGLVVFNQVSENRIQETSGYVNDAQNKEKYDNIQSLSKEAQRYKSMMGEAEDMKTVLDSYPEPDSGVKDQIVACAGASVAITIDAYDCSTGSYEFTAMAAQVTDISDFIDKLNKTDIFNTMEYSGYNYTEQTGQYDIQVTGSLSETAGK